jgi:peptidoglycan biosynthesis protein MviN/MurJ (putative lipid II flippase)
MAIAAAVSLAIGIAIRQPLIAILFERGNFTQSLPARWRAVL